MITEGNTNSGFPHLAVWYVLVEEPAEGLSGASILAPEYSYDCEGVPSFRPCQILVLPVLPGSQKQLFTEGPKFTRTVHSVDVHLVHQGREGKLLE